ncbi:RRM domain-containing protein [Haematococcus lacustris]|uniref:RRM domain-containing protein n=1 Tax=Haematococcus lacustris TaxID=44745 RepID=A0A699ZHL5_HAELA|nr:RRM domain-containing protein [Haematococcus lacustris]
MLGSTYGLDPSTVAMGAMGGLETEITETPPAGCAPDAIKLFVGNIPKSCTEEQLLPFFETVGLVVELVILNLRHVLPDPSGQQDRPLVVRKAKSRANKMGNHLGQQGMDSLPSHAALAMQQSQQGMYGQAGGMPQLQISSAGMQANYRGLQPMGLQPTPQLVGMQRAAAAEDGGLYNSYAREASGVGL